MHVGREHFLVGGIVAIHHHGEFLHEIATPSELGVFLVKSVGAVEFAAFLALQEEKVELAVIVSHSSLLSVASASSHGKHPNHPLMVGEEVGTQQFVAEVDFTEHEGEIDGNEPEVAAHAIENTPDA